MVAFVTIEDDYPKSALLLYNSMLVEVLDLFQGSLIVSLAIWRGLNDLVRQEAALSILGGKVVNALDDYKQKQYKAIATYVLNYSRLFLIARLKLLALATLISMYNDYTAANNTHYKAHLVEVVEVVVLDAVLCMHVGYQLELRVYLVGVFIKGPLEVIGTQQMHLKLRAALYKAVYLLLADRLCTMYCKERIRYIFHTTDLGGESLRIQVENISYKRLFFTWGQIILGIANLGLRNTALYSIDEGYLKDVVSLCSSLGR